MDAVAPAKAIISGEHAVVYGAPALAVAINRHARCRLDRIGGASLSLHLPDLNLHRTLSATELPALAAGCRERHRAFEAGTLPVSRVLAREEDLLLYALADLVPADTGTHLDGLSITLSSDIPVGAGMGSSAATVAALLRAVAAALELPLDERALLAHTRSAESLQHGRSSGIDPAICCRGGAIRYQQGRIEPVALELDQSWYLADSGRPQASTGVCVEQVRRNFANSAIWSEFADVTETLYAAIRRADPAAIVTALRHNHRLLCEIGVVPEPVQAWIAGLERSGGAGKISGAGSVTGSSAGGLLIYHPAMPETQLNNHPVMLLETDCHGARVRN
ncbi:mevalonate kinase [Motiliproteus sp. SC1-56]|uniref:mevalonate kinase family protein n=1 Tax=Motiliproteus sp. SC1-56 TaxID=2799565 RepID=UPI001A8D415E|nr:mevalonate kinase [Motiliproteus sp. SC1-56]